MEFNPKSNTNVINKVTLPLLTLPERVKKSHLHRHPVPSPQRGGNFFLYLNIFALSPGGRGEGEGDRIINNISNFHENS
jgi:hypothetical protein